MSATLPHPGRVHIIRVPNGRAVTLAEYCRSWRTLKTMEGVFDYDHGRMDGWNACRAAMLGDGDA